MVLSTSPAPPDPPAAPGSPAGSTASATSTGSDLADLIGVLAMRHHEEYESAAARHQLTGIQARVLALLARRPLPMRRLAERLKCEPSNITGLVDRLEARGMVRRRADPADRRVKLVVVTDEGRDAAEQVRSAADFTRAPLAGLSEEDRAALRELLRRVLG